MDFSVRCLTGVIIFGLAIVFVSSLGAHNDLGEHIAAVSDGAATVAVVPLRSFASEGPATVLPATPTSDFFTSSPVAWNVTHQDSQMVSFTGGSYPLPHGRSSLPDFLKEHASALFGVDAKELVEGKVTKNDDSIDLVFEQRVHDRRVFDASLKITMKNSNIVGMENHLVPDEKLKTRFKVKNNLQQICILRQWECPDFAESVWYIEDSKLVPAFVVKPKGTSTKYLVSATKGEIIKNLKTK